MWKVKTSWRSRSKSDAKAQRKWGTYIYNLNFSLKFLSFYSLDSTGRLDHRWKPKDGWFELLWEWSPSTNVSHVWLLNLPASSLINNWVAKWRLGAWETSRSFLYWQPALRWRLLFLAGKSELPSHTPPCRMGETQAPVALLKSVEKGVREGKRWYLGPVNAQNANAWKESWKSPK